ncbi:hypothetical protein MRX96_054316 [Rhipicephalus microplus]
MPGKTPHTSRTQSHSRGGGVYAPASAAVLVHSTSAARNKSSAHDSHTATTPPRTEVQGKAGTLYSIRAPFIAWKRAAACTALTPPPSMHGTGVGWGCILLRLARTASFFGAVRAHPPTLFSAHRR